MWDAGQYLRFGGERARPFFDLIARSARPSPGYVADLGCGPGNLTAALAAALARRRGHRRGQLAGDDRRRARGGAADGRPALRARRRAGLAASAAARRAGLQRRAAVGARPRRPAAALGRPARARRLARLPAAGQLRPAEPRDRQGDGARHRAGGALLAGAKLNRQAGDPAEYVDLLARPGFQVDAWETSYLHILHGDEPGARVDQGQHAAAGAFRARRGAGRRLPRASTGNGCWRVSPASVRYRLPLPPGVRGACTGPATRAMA